MNQELSIKKLKLKPLRIGGHNLGFIIPKKKFEVDLDKEYFIDLFETCAYPEVDNGKSKNRS